MQSNFNPNAWKEKIIFGALDPASTVKSRKAVKVGLVALAILFTVSTFGIGAIFVYKLYETYTEKLKEIDSVASDIIQSSSNAHAKRDEFKIKRSAAITIQKMVRGYQTRKRTAPELAGLQEKKKAASTLQAGVRGYLARRELNVKKTERDVSRIQSAARGYLNRIEVAEAISDVFSRSHYGFNSNRHCSVQPKDLLNKIAVNQELKKRFLKAKSTPSFSVLAVDSPASVSETMLNLTGSTIKQNIRENPNYSFLGKERLDKIENLAEQLIKNEKIHSRSIVGYHGNKSSLLSDIYGSLAHALMIGEEGDEVPLPRLEAHMFERDSSALTEDTYIHDHNEIYRRQFISASPTLISSIFSRELENALHFYSRGESISKESNSNRVFELLEQWQLKEFNNSQINQAKREKLLNAIHQIEGLFEQYGYIYQIFFHDCEKIDNQTYPSAAYGRPVGSTTTEFLLALSSHDRQKQIDYRKKYHIPLNQIQFRIMPDPRLFIDRSRVTVYCHRQLPIHEVDYRKKIRKEVVEMILEEGLNQRGPGGLFGLSPLAKTLGQKTPFARLVDYVFIGTTDPRIWAVYGNIQAVIKALEKKEITPISTFGTEETLLELSLMAGQVSIFEILFDEFKKSKCVLNEKLAQKLLALCFQHQLVDSTEYLIDYVSNPKLLGDLLYQASEKNFPQLIRKIILKKNFKIDTLSIESALKNCLKYQNVEDFEKFAQEYYNRGIKKYDPFHLKLLSYILQYSQPEKVSSLISILQKIGYDINFLEKCLIEDGYSFQLQKQQKYYYSLSQEERLTLPLQEFWKTIDKVQDT